MVRVWEAGRVEYRRGAVYHRFYSPFLFPTIEDDDDNGDQTYNSKNNTEDYQGVLV